VQLQVLVSVLEEMFNFDFEIFIKYVIFEKFKGIFKIVHEINLHALCVSVL